MMTRNGSRAVEESRRRKRSSLVKNTWQPVAMASETKEASHWSLLLLLGSAGNGETFSRLSLSSRVHWTAAKKW